MAQDRVITFEQLWLSLNLVLSLIQLGWFSYLHILYYVDSNAVLLLYRWSFITVPAFILSGVSLLMTLKPEKTKTLNSLIEPKNILFGILSLILSITTAYLVVFQFYCTWIAGDSATRAFRADALILMGSVWISCLWLSLLCQDRSIPGQ